MPRIQRKVAALLTALVALTTLASGLLAERGLRERERRRLEASLAERAALVRELLGGIALAAGDTARLDPLARRAAAAAGARVTLIAADGRVLADSEVPAHELGRVDNHRERPEVAAALAGAPGHSTRRSATVDRPQLYLAVPGPGGGAVRLSVDLAQVDAAAVALRRQLLLAGGVGLLAALALSFPISWFALRPLREMGDALAALAGGDLRPRLLPRTRDELGEMARALNRTAEQLEGRLGQVTEEREQLRAVLGSMVEGVLVLDAQGRIALANPRLRELLGHWGPVEERRLLEAVRHPGLDEALRAASRSSTPVVAELEIGGPGERHLLVHAVRFPADGPRRGTVAVFHDVSELRRLETVRRDFVANASHELQTPVTAIRGFAETLLASDLPRPEARSYLEVILRHAERLENLIRDLLELSRLESRRAPLQASEVDVARVAETLLRDLAARLRERSLEASLEAKEAVAAWGDRRAVEQVLANLLDNAAKYTDPGGRVTVRVAAAGDRLRVEVRDTGIGIPDAERARIFERFYRVDKARSRALGGTGLGLAIVRHLVHAMGGEIHVESEPGRGSTFAFTLPRADAQPAGEAS